MKFAVAAWICLTLMFVSCAEEGDAQKPADSPLVQQAKEALAQATKKFNELADRKKLLERQIIAIQNFHDAAENSKEKANQDRDAAERKGTNVINSDDRTVPYRGHYGYNGIIQDQVTRSNSGAAVVSNAEERNKAARDEAAANKAIDQNHAKLSTLKRELEAVTKDYVDAEAEKKAASESLAMLQPAAPKAKGNAYELVLNNGEIINAISVIESADSYTVKTENKKFRTILKSDVASYHFEPSGKQ